MKIQVNSDKTVHVDATLSQFVEVTADRILGRFATKITRVEVHLSDVDSQKTGHADKRCLIEVRPTGDRPVSASAQTTKTESAVAEALGKMQRSLTTLFGRKGRVAKEVSAPVATAKKTVATKTIPDKTGKAAVKKTIVKKTAVKKPTKLSPRGPKKKAIYQARRKSSPRK
jgi:hypothetical protein